MFYRVEDQAHDPRPLWVNSDHIAAVVVQTDEAGFWVCILVLSDGATRIPIASPDAQDALLEAEKWLRRVGYEADDGDL